MRRDKAFGCVCLCVCLGVPLCVCPVRTLFNPWLGKFLWLYAVRLQSIFCQLVYEGRRAKIKVTGVKRSSERNEIHSAFDWKAVFLINLKSSYNAVNIGTRKVRECSLLWLVLYVKRFRCIQSLYKRNSHASVYQSISLMDKIQRTKRNIRPLTLAH